MSLFSAAERLAALDRSAVVFDPARCLHTLDKFNQCDACYNLCPADAIETGKPPVFRDSLCQHCNACLAVCPVGAYHGVDAVQSLVTIATRLEVESLEVYCQLNPEEDKKAPEADASVRVRGCLAGLGDGAYMALRSLGIDKVYLRKDACKDCPWESISGKIDQQVAQTQTLLDLWGIETFASVVNPATLVERDEDAPIWDADNPPLSRRGLFKMLSHQGQETFARLAIQSEPSHRKRPSLNHLRNFKEVELMDADQVSDPSHSLAQAGLATILVNEDCSACGTCEHVCPTEALKLDKSMDEDEQLTYRLLFTPTLCAGCEACVHVCYPEAIQMVAAPTFQDVFGHPEPLALRQGILRRCQRCKHDFAPKGDEQLCPICSYREQNPLGSHMPPALMKQIQALKQQRQAGK